MYENRLLYSNMAANDPFFFAKVMFKIDNALQKHWRFCSNSSHRESVNDNVLRMEDVQQSIVDLDFLQMLPKSISDKVSNLLNSHKDEKDKNPGGGRNGKKIPGGKLDIKDKEELTMTRHTNPGKSRKMRSSPRFSTHTRRNAPRRMKEN
jgi:hypothetical protein